MSRTPRGVAGLVLAAAALAVAATGCGQESSNDGSASAAAGSASKPTSNETYYWISQNSTLPLFVAHDYPALKQAAKELGVKVKMTGPTTIDLPSFISTVNQVCAQKPAGVMVVGWDPSLSSAVDQCMKEGVPTVTDDADLPNSKRLAFIGTDWYDIGVAQAKALITATGGKGKIATESIINADNMKQARQGFADTLKGTGLQLVAQEDDGGDSSQAASKTASLLAAHPDLAGIAGFDSESGAGIVRALKEAHKNGQVKVTAMEQTPEFFKTVQTGDVSAIIVQKRTLFTYYALKTLYDYNHNGLTIDGLTKDQGASPVPVDINTGLVVVDKSNVANILAAGNKP
ncbi:MAG TPA: substrate-binding domain-containing protein [Baekduia sp.]